MNNTKKYSEEFKKQIVSLHQNGKTYALIQDEYGVPASTLAKWTKLYSVVKTDDGSVMTYAEIQKLQKRMAELEEENMILKKAISIFTPH
ncbi:MAG: transposase [Clostridia bacterium]